MSSWPMVIPAGHDEIIWLAKKMNLRLVILGKTLEPLQVEGDGEIEVMLSNEGPLGLRPNR